MTTLLTFIIPVRHPDNAKDWSALKRNLSTTLKSISAQTDNDWRCIVVANHGSDLPPLPKQVEVKHVDFPPNPHFDLDKAPKEIAYDTFRFDKGRRVLTGMLHARNSDYFMIVDDDDFVSRNIASFVKQHRGENGWHIKQGYVWEEGGRLLYIHNEFPHHCGTCLIIKSDLYHLPSSLEEANPEEIKAKLGSHVKIHDILKKQNTPLAPLPFFGAIYRIGHVGAHSKSKGLIKTFFLQKELLRRPKELIRRFFRFRKLSRKIRKEFMGE